MDMSEEARHTMHTTRYLIVGGGLTADAACKGIRDVDAEGHITVVAAEAHPPYARPPVASSSRS